MVVLAQVAYELLVTICLQVWEVGAQMLGLAGSIAVLKAIEVRLLRCCGCSKCMFCMDCMAACRQEACRSRAI
jgi:hypothetical protein